MSWCEMPNPKTNPTPTQGRIMPQLRVSYAFAALPLLSVLCPLHGAALAQTSSYV